MLTQIENRYGIISYDTSLMDQMINEALAPYKDCFKLLKKESDMSVGGVSVRLNVQLKFGISIQEFSGSVLRSIGNRIEENLELPVRSVELVISGIYSKKTVKRNIVIEYNNRSEITDNRY